MEVKTAIVMQEQEHQWQMSDWWYRETCPPNDNAYFENMTHVIFQAGLNWRVIDSKWSGMRKAFANFNINKVACYTSADVQRLMQDTDIVRNKRKIEATIYNAQGFQAIKKQYGTFKAYIDSLDKSNNYSNVVKDLIDKFKFLGPSTASTFLYSVCEKISPWA
jgi:DNA-3-methyladenine glycosylase I